MNRHHVRTAMQFRNFVNSHHVSLIAACLLLGGVCLNSALGQIAVDQPDRAVAPFLSYTPKPIEITVVVRRNPANDNAGFKLVYESTDGYKNRGWYTVPDNTRWHTMKWRLDDAQFVGMWGYNFSLDSDGDQYNKYFIRSVTVTKLDK